jgi:hypothetical protein
LNFFRAKEQAKRLTFSELRAHAKVSTDNRHFCHDCFCCACLEVLREHASHKKWTGTIADARQIDWSAFTA